MKTSFTTLLLMVGFGTFAQVNFNLPYNPDANGDGLIGVADLQGLLATYGSEFENAIVAGDGESAIMDMGNMGYAQCQYACQKMPGYWTLPDAADLTPVFPLVENMGIFQFWLKEKSDAAIIIDGLVGVPMLQYHSPGNLLAGGAGGSHLVYETNIFVAKNCYCSTKQLPRVEYTYCEGTSIQTCANGLASEGWYPVGGAMKHNSEGENKIQAFWRWAQYD